MQFYKDLSGNIHAIERDEFANLLPAGCVPVDPPAPTTSDASSDIKRQLVELDIKRIRPLAEGDVEYLAKLNADAIALRAKL